MKGRKRAVFWVAAVAAVGAGMVAALTSGTAARGEPTAHLSAGASPQPELYTSPLARGKREGYLWGVTADVRRYRPLKRVCLFVTTVPPPPPGQDYVQSYDSSTCGRLTQPSESVSMLMGFGEGDASAGVLVATVYEPSVRKVSYALVDGGTKVIRTKLRKTMRPGDKGVPKFRYVAFVLDPGSCVDRITTYGGDGAVIAREKAEPGC